MSEQLPLAVQQICPNKNNNDLEEILTENHGITVWSRTQEVLESEAKEEIEIFTKENKQKVPESTTNNGEETNNFNVRNLDNHEQESEIIHTLTYINQESPDSSGIAQNNSNKRKCVKNKAQGSSHSTIRSVLANNTEDDQESDAHNEQSGSEYEPSEIDSEDDEDYAPENIKNVIREKPKKATKLKKSKSIKSTLVKDDGLLANYRSRLNLYYEQLEKESELKSLSCNVADVIEDEETHDVVIEDNLKVGMEMWNRLYSYQQDGIKWLWNLHQKSTGGLLGDEMGLGKTVQIIVFLHAIQYSRIVNKFGRFTGLGPTMIVCPVTVIHQWVKHFYEWSPEFRVAVLHQSGSFQGNKADLIKDINKNKGILITTYSSLIKYKGNLIEHHWHYLILDEGHKIRNPTAKITVAAKGIRTPHRLMLTGSPMQNNLVELWSLFDFTNPGMLGELRTFQEHFANPILYGGFSNATPMQEATALSVACTLKNVISPFLLRRTKHEVQHHIVLPDKSEQVLFCSLTQEQRDLYKGYLMSDHVNMILGRGAKMWHSKNYIKSNMLIAITALRKICNHPDIYLEEDPKSLTKFESMDSDTQYNYQRSGKMIVVSALLKIWKRQGHRVLLFSQGRAMISVFQGFLESQGYTYLKMDGSTSVKSRQSLIDTFNQDTTIDVFLLTTRVGGLGVNLTGANRVIIYDPDWNPATDTQARERAWRIGQQKQVTIYRLLSAGTIEEKMYQRQIWKQLLSNKILVDPSTQRFFKSGDLFDLFSLQENPESNPETTNIFRESRVRMQENLRNKKKSKKKRRTTELSSSEQIGFTEDKIQAMKTLAQQIAKSLSSTKVESQTPKTFYQLEIEDERKAKLAERSELLKTLTPQELLDYNREKAKDRDNSKINTIDDSKTTSGFDTALQYAEQTSKLYHELNCGKVPVKVKRKIQDVESSAKKIKVAEKVSKKSVKVDKSGQIDGERVEGLVRREVKRKRKSRLNEDDEPVGVCSSQNSFVLKHLFSKTGVSGALEHDSVVQSGSSKHTLKMRTEADIKANKSLEALRKSRLNAWRW